MEEPLLACLSAQSCRAVRVESLWSGV